MWVLITFPSDVDDLMYNISVYTQTNGPVLLINENEERTKSNIDKIFE